MHNWHMLWEIARHTCFFIRVEDGSSARVNSRVRVIFSVTARARVNDRVRVQGKW